VSRARRVLGVGLAIAVAVALVGAGVAYAAVSSPTIPTGAASTRIAIAENLDAAKLPDPPQGAASDALSPYAGGCLPRVSRPGGWLDLCWSVFRVMSERDAAEDYYVLRVWGTASGNPGLSGLRWAVVRARPDAESDPFEFRAGWPDTRTFDGRCREARTDMGFFDQLDEPIDVCGRTTGLSDPSDPAATGFEWTCAGCLFPMSTTQAILLTEAVAVPEGRSPIWDLYADIGS
jgi:hypothetical protein